MSNKNVETINIMNEIDVSMANQIIRKIADIKEDIANNKTNPKVIIEIHINSSGGDVDAVLSIISALKYSGMEIHTYAYGDVSSAAFIIYCFGEKRFATIYSQFMYHRFRCIINNNTLSNHDNFIKHVENKQTLTDNLIIANTLIPGDTLKIYENSAWYIDIKEAIELKICTHIASANDLKLT